MWPPMVMAGLFYAFSTAADFTFTNSTISGNSATGNGGGLAFGSFDGNALLQNSTITGNTANSTGCLHRQRGGGVAFLFGSGSASINSTIVGGNLNPNKQCQRPRRHGCNHHGRRTPLSHRFQRGSPLASGSGQHLFPCWPR